MLQMMHKKYIKINFFYVDIILASRSSLCAQVSWVPPLGIVEYFNENHDGKWVVVLSLLLTIETPLYYQSIRASIVLSTL